MALCKILICHLVPVEEESLTSKFVWGQVLSENLARLAQNHFATRHYLTLQVLPELEKDLVELHNYANQLGSDEDLAAYQDWIHNYKEVITAIFFPSWKGGLIHVGYTLGCECFDKGHSRLRLH